ncbi:MAG: hypothetical protein [Olavius algarvensis Gamma 1 endosymbiont]|nr:MAG: hypothetical protein [Olavius algarvensis Gamma 1 endosymbiont]
MSPERRAKGGLGCPVSHPEHGDTLTSSLLTHRVIPAFITATIVPIRFPSSSASLRETCSTPIAESAGIPE